MARIVVEYLEGLGMKFPPPSVDLKHIREEYHSAEKGATPVEAGGKVLHTHYPD